MKTMGLRWSWIAVVVFCSTEATQAQERAFTALQCQDAGEADTSGGPDGWADYCGDLDLFGWTGPERVFHVRLPESRTVEFTVRNTSEADLDLFALNSDPQGDPDPDACLDSSKEASGSERVFFFAEAQQDYYLVVDGYDGAQGTFEYELNCESETCNPEMRLMDCGVDLPGSTLQENNHLSAVSGLPFSVRGPDTAYRFTPDKDQMVSLVLNIDLESGLLPVDLVLMLVRADDAGECQPAGLIDYSDAYQGFGILGKILNPPEEIHFLAEAGKTYFVVVDSADAATSGTFHLRADCVVHCDPNLLACGDDCINPHTDLDHCGECQRSCRSDHTTSDCLSGECVVLDCDPGYADCNGLAADGCETPLGTTENCTDCADTCVFDHATAGCEQGQCQMLACLPDWADCDGDPQNGCEQHLGSPEHCAGCDHACRFDHAQATCQDGECDLAACLPGWTDCNQVDADGCETKLGTTADCGACGHACDPDQVCEAGQCRSTCSSDTQDCAGACVDLSSDVWHCGDCDLSCDPGQQCIEGHCVPACADADADGHLALECGGDDCDDGVSWTHAGAEEICDLRDNDCDGQIDEDDVCGQWEPGCATGPGGPFHPAGWLLLIPGMAWLAGRRRRPGHRVVSLLAALLYLLSVPAGGRAADKAGKSPTWIFDERPAMEESDLFEPVPLVDPLPIPAPVAPEPETPPPSLAPEIRAPTTDRSAPAAAPAPEPAVVQQRHDPDRIAVSSTAAAPSTQRILGWSMLGSSAGAAVMSSVLFYLTYDSRTEADGKLALLRTLPPGSAQRESVEAEKTALYRNAQRQWTAAWVCAGAAGLAAVVGSYLLLTEHGPGDGPGSDLEISAGHLQGGGWVGLSGTF